MIPLQLQIKNFLSYGPEIQTIDFSSYHLICLSGKNGHGKSALLDAMTWALWGQARKVLNAARADQGLIRLGQLQMLVVFDFIFNGTTYRVRREFSNYYNKPQINLDFGILETTTQELVPLTEKTIRDTQAKIHTLLNLDYESFINSAFLRQGGSNEFSKKSPRERKQVFADILGLGHYEQLRKAASNKVKETIAEKNLLASLHEKNKNDLTLLTPTKTRRTLLVTELAQLVEREKVCAKLYNQIVEEKKDCTHKQQQATLLSFQQEQCTTQEQQALTALQTARNAWKALHTKLRTIDHNADLYTQRDGITQQIQDLQNNRNKELQLREELLKQKEAIQKLEVSLRESAQKQVTEHVTTVQRHTIELEACTRTIAEHSAKHTALEKELVTLNNSRTALEQKSTALAQTLSSLKCIEQQFEKRRNAYQRWITEGNWLTKELTGLQDKQKFVHDTENPSCPLCEQNLSAARKRFLKQTFEQKEHYLTHRINRLHKLVQNLKKLLFEQHERLTQLKQEQEELTRLTVQINEARTTCLKQQALLQEISIRKAQLNQQKTDTEVALARAHASHTTATAQQTQHVQDDTAYNAQSEHIKQIEQQLSLYKYDMVLHNRLIEELKLVEIHIADKVHSAELSNKKQRIALDVQDICTNIRALRQQKASYALQQQAYNGLTAQLTELIAQENSLAKEMQELASTKNNLLEEKGRLDSEYEKLTCLEQEVHTQAASLITLENCIQDYQAIAHATSKEGIQALLIEDAIPEIEQEANQLLARLTNNQAQISIESLRDLKKGGTKETLDIKISDAVGIRPYELFSGGEAFRIDFALRIAISKLLARRAGTSLQTLIIDEGFGSQDEEGLTNIMEAIYKIQDHFAKIIIVSHLDSMKNQFPVHLFVEKGANGSYVRAIEQG